MMGWPGSYGMAKSLVDIVAMSWTNDLTLVGARTFKLDTTRDSSLLKGNPVTVDFSVLRVNEEVPLAMLYSPNLEFRFRKTGEGSWPQIWKTN